MALPSRQEGSYALHMGNLNIIKGDITQAPADAIVNAANPSLLGGGGVDGAIHLAAGPQLLMACQNLEANNGIRCPTGQARITSAGKLKAQYVIHTVGPRYHIDPNPEQLLHLAYKNSLALALIYQCRSIAFPAISCGVYGYPIDEAADIAVSACQHDDFKHLSICFYLPQQTTFNAWKRLVK